MARQKLARGRAQEADEVDGRGGGVLVYDIVTPLPLGEDKKPYERRELGGVGEGLCPVDRADPLTQLQLGNKLPSLRNPLPVGEGSLITRQFLPA